MASLVQVCLALLLVSCVHGQSLSFPGRCFTTTFNSQVSNCSRDLQYALGIASPTDAVALHNVVCTNIEAGITYIGCVRSAYETCLSSEFYGLLQTDARARDAFQYYCDHKNEMNVNCLSGAVSSDTCSNSALSVYSTVLAENGLVPTTCNLMKTLGGCYFNSGASCLNHDRNVYNTYWVKSYPPTCGGARSAPTTFLLLGACTMLLNKMGVVFSF